MKKREFWKDFKTYEDASITFKEYINQGISIGEIANMYDITIERVNNILVRYDDTPNPVVYKAIKEHYSQFTINDNKAVVISDTHIGNMYEYLALFDTIFNFCSKYNIKNIIHAGDFIEGNSHLPLRKYLVDGQIATTFRIFNQNGIPKMFYLCGNHEYNLEIHDSICLKDKLKVLKNLIHIGNGYSYIQLNDKDPINIFHELSYGESFTPEIRTNLKLEGHHHNYQFFDNNIIDLPPLSLVGGNHNLGFVTLTTTGNEFILDIYKGLSNNEINYYEQKIITKHL